jgi:hypothetical protein
MPIWLREGTMAKLTNAIIEAAIDGFEAQKQRIDVQIAQLRAMLTGASESAEEAPAKGTRKRFSAASRKRMREAQQIRWAKFKGTASAPAAKAPPQTAAKTAGKAAAKAAKPKGGITVAGRKALSIAMKKRWAAKKAA